MPKSFLFTAAVVIGAAAVSTPFAHADVTRHPNVAAGYCPGGRMDTDVSVICDGEGFGDGSFYRDVMFTKQLPAILQLPPDSIAAAGLHCLINVRVGNTITVKAAPHGSGACGGEA